MGGVSGFAFFLFSCSSSTCILPSIQLVLFSSTLNLPFSLATSGVFGETELPFYGIFAHICSFLCSFWEKNIPVIPNYFFAVLFWFVVKCWTRARSAVCVMDAMSQQYLYIGCLQTFWTTRASTTQIQPCITASTSQMLQICDVSEQSTLVITTATTHRQMQLFPTLTIFVTRSENYDQSAHRKRKHYIP